MAKGSLTVFVSLIMVSVMTLIFAMSECIRFVSMDNFAQQYTDMALESAFSEYNPYLWANYKILAIDTGYGTEDGDIGKLENRVAKFCQENSNYEGGKNFGKLKLGSCQIEDYSLLSDGNGSAVVNLGVKSAKEGLASQLVAGLDNLSKEMNSFERISINEKVSSAKNDLDNAKRALQEQKEQAKKEGRSVDDLPEPPQMEEDPFELFSQMQAMCSKGLLSTVVPSASISDADILVSQMPSHRSLARGTLEVNDNNSLLNKALFIDYLISNYSYYSNDLGHAGIQYEVEYLIAGQKSDVLNLTSVIEQILLVREAANFSTIMANPTLYSQAEAIAATLAGWTLNPAIVQATYYAICGIWAYAESILDIRSLMTSKSIPIIKNVEQWSADIYHLSGILDVNTKAKECKTGITYKDYLISLLALKSDTSLGRKALDVMENALSQTEDYENVKIDNMLWAAEVSTCFTADEMFTSIFSSKQNGYQIEKKKFLSY